MKVWRKKRETEFAPTGVARAALAGASREELLRETLQALAREGNADRIGVWAEADSDDSYQDEGSGEFRGMVWDRENPENPSEWRNLSAAPPLPDELLLRGKTVEEDLNSSPKRPIIGQLLGLRRALWIPVTGGGHLRGVILAGSKGKQLTLSRERAESLAAELALALERLEQQKILRSRNADLAAARRFLGAQAAGHSVETLLSNLAASCTASAASGDGLGAAFAVLGVLPNPNGISSGIVQPEFHWRSGDEDWTRAVESEPLASVWRRALVARQLVGSEPHVGWKQKSVARIVAFPLEGEGQLLGILVAGLSSGAASLATLDRLELRAALAASALWHRRKKEEEGYQARWQQGLLDLIEEPLLLVDQAGTIVVSSRGARELAGPATKAEAIHRGLPSVPKHFSQLFRGRERERIQRWLRNSRHGLQTSQVPEEAGPQAELDNGTSVQMSLVPPVPGQPAVILLDPLSVRDAKGPEERTETELQNVIEWLEEGVLLFDARDNVRAINTRFAQIANLAPGEAGEFKTLEALINRLAGHAAEPAHFADRWRALARGIEGGVREELQMLRPVPRILERAARPVLDSQGRHLGRVEIYRDLTAQRVFHSKLLQTEKLAALGQMVSSIAHELSNPLTSILGYAQRLLVRQETSGRLEEARQIYQEAERASTILRQLLLNARETVPERRLLSLNQIVLQSMDLQGLGLAAEKIRVEIDLDPTLPFVHGDPGHLQQVLMNLIGNARHALEQQAQGGTIRLRTKRIGERRVLLEVKDNGPGIPQGILARIFDPFFTTKPAGVGTGLGLAIVLSAIREHGGQVHVLSPPEGGAVFQIELPAAAESLSEELAGPILLEKIGPLAQAVPLARLEDGAATFEAAKGARVLVVEDEPTVARLIADVLEDEGMLVDVLLDGRQALARAARKSYDLVICDMKMPGLDGQHFYKSLERTENPLREYFLFVTGDIVAAQTREFLERHRLPHVAKPFRVEELTEKVHAMLEIKFLRKSSAEDVSKKNAAGKG
jgi:signal transduction histidine kinase/FixJ family two-component response regulator